MPLTLAVLLGFLAGSLRAAIQKSSLQIPTFKHSWLIVVALIPQILVFQISQTRQLVPLSLAKGILAGSLIGLSIFVWANHKQPGLRWLGLGLALNLIVIVSNGGLMPISPETASYVYPHTAPDVWNLGERLGFGKDVVLLPAETRFEFLADRFRLPLWMPYRVAYSLGDVFIAVGAFWLLWSAGKPQ